MSRTGTEISGLGQGPRAPLWTRPFLAVNLIAFLVYCNMALFFLLFDQLRGMGLDPRQAGMVIAAFSTSVLLMRPFISTFMHAGNARLWMGLGASGVAVALAIYPLCASWKAFLILRVMHGLAYVVMATATMAAFSACVPQQRSGEAFGVMGVVTLLPYAVLPPLVAPLAVMVGGYMNLVALTAPVMLLVLPLMLWLGPGMGAGPGQAPGRPGRREIMANLADPAVLSLLVLFLLLTTCFAAQFYFIAPFADARGIAQAGLFFTLSTCSEIGVRFGSRRWLDRLPKNRLMAAAVIWLAACFAGLALCSSQWLFIGLALANGLGWGVAFPLFSALLFDLSPPRLRAMNTNLGMVSFQGGLMLGPLVGGFLSAGLGFGGVFMLCAGVCLVVTVGLCFLRVRPGGPGQGQAGPEAAGGMSA